MLVKKSVLDGVGRFDESFRGPEDYDLWIRVAGECKVLRVDEEISLYREVAGSLSMDDRKFLPQVLRVLEKAYTEGGVLSGMPELRATAEAGQFWNASWMAYRRGSRRVAIKYLHEAFIRNRVASEKMIRPWVSVLLRYLLF